MLKKRIIPIVLLDGFSVLKTIKFEQRRNLGSPITVMRTYNTRNVDELILLDIDASKQGRSIDAFVIEELARECFMPLTVGGGITTIEDIEVLLRRGADKVCINTIAIKNPEFIRKASSIFGRQCITVSIDVVECGGKYYRYSDRHVNKDLDIAGWIKLVEMHGAGEILINNVSRDGMMAGGDEALSTYVSGLVNIPVIYAGGISSPEDAAAIAMTPVSGVGISSIFHFTDFTPEECRGAMRELNIPAR